MEFYSKEIALYSVYTSFLMERQTNFNIKGVNYIFHTTLHMQTFNIF